MSKCECKECLHYEVCLYKPCVGECPLYKSKSMFVELPCKVGTKIYFIFRYSDKRLLPFVRSGKVKRFYCGNNKNQFLMDAEIESKEKGIIRSWYFSDFGETVFLDRAEAEKKLKEMG